MTHSERTLSKLVTTASLPALLKLWAGEKVVFTNGCFDLLHRGHVDYLAKAANLGTRLFVAVNTDRSVSALKGPHRPLQDETSRLIILASLACVDAVMLFDEATPYNLIKAVKPAVLVKGSDYRPREIVGYDIVTEAGGEVCTIDFLPGFSTTAIVKRARMV